MRIPKLQINLFLAVVAIMMSLAGTIMLHAQQETRATLGGRVTDPQRLPIPDATVTVISDATGVANRTKTNNAGDWQVRFLVPGFYHFQVDAPGFKRLERASIQLIVADQKIIDTQLQLGAQNETVTVDATTPLIDLSSAATGTVVEDSEIEELPTNSNSPTQLIGLVPGATVGGTVGGTGVYLWSNGGLSGSTVNGSGNGASAINFSIDGGADNQNNGGLAFEPPSDAVAQFRVITNAYDASIGRESSATVNLALKSGGNAFHGDLYEWNYSNWLNAIQTGVGYNPSVHLNQYGGSVGGPIWIPKVYDGRKKQTYFFYTWSGIRNRQPAVIGTMSLPTALERQGDFSQSFVVVSGVRYPVQIYDPTTIDPATGNRQLFPGNKIPSGQINAFAKAFFAAMPEPDNAGDGASSDSNNYFKREVQDDFFKGQTGRLDQNWNNQNHSYVDLRWNTWHELSYDPFGPNNILNGLYQKRVNKGITLDHTLVLSPKLVLDLRYNLTRWEGSSYDSSVDTDPASFGASSALIAAMVKKTLPEIQGIGGGYELGGYGTAQAGTYGYDTSHYFTGSITQTHGNHTLRYGAEYMVQQNDGANLGAAGGVFNFGTNWTTQNPNATAGNGVGSSIASFLLGLPTSGSLTTPAYYAWSQHFTGVYFQDDWRATSRLTLNVGLRWDYERPMTERDNRYYFRYDPNYVNQAVTAVAQPVYAGILGSSSTNTGVQLVQQYGAAAGQFQAKGAVLYAGLNGTSPYIVNPRYKYFQPRLGFAYLLYPKTVLRGGVGRFVQSGWALFSGNQAGYSATTSFLPTNDNYYTVNASIDSPFPQGMVPVTGNSLGVNTNFAQTTSFTDPNFGRNYTDQASASIQQQVGKMLIEIGGTLNATHGLSVGYNVNRPSTAAWQSAFTPTFDSTGRPVDTLAGNQQVANPFKGSPYITNGLQSAKTLTAFQLLRPNPVVGDITYYRPTGKTIYYALETKVERRFGNGLSFLQAFTWSKRIAENTLIGSQFVGARIDRRLDPADNKFHYTMAPVYELPFGQGKRFLNRSNRWMNALVGGYEVTGVYTFLSGTPLVLPTNNSFYKGGDPGSGFVKSRTHQFDTSKFYPFPTRSTTVAQLQAYPTWTGVTGMPGYGYTPTNPNDATKNGVYQDFATWNTYHQSTFGDVRYPPVNDFTLGIRKSFAVTEGVRLQLRMDAFNALNHPRFGGTSTSPSSPYFGYLSGSLHPTQANSPRQIQLGARLVF